MRRAGGWERLTRGLVVVTTAGLMVACGDGAGTLEADATVDVGADVGADGNGADGEADTTPDEDVDAGSDAVEDVDAGTDADEDADGGTDAAEDVDAVEDLDAGPDADDDADIVEDVENDGAGDADAVETDAGGCASDEACDDGVATTVDVCEDDGTCSHACVTGYTGDACDTCADGWQDADEDGVCLPTCATAALECGSHGACDDLSGVASCVCDPGYGGDACDACAEGHQDEDGDGLCAPDCATLGLDCGANGACTTDSGAAVCVCDEGYDGDLCDGCEAGWQDDDLNGVCAPDCATAALDCGVHGACATASGAAECVCDEGYDGAACEVCAEGWQDEDEDGECLVGCELAGIDCGAHGACVTLFGFAECACDEGYQGAACELCAEGWQDADEDGQCLVGCELAALDCGPHGACDDASGVAGCACDTGYAGAGCESCAEGWQDDDGDDVCQPGCDLAALDCPTYRECSTETGVAACVCVAGHTGEGCAECAAGYQDNDADSACAPGCDGLGCPEGFECDDASGAIVCTTDWPATCAQVLANDPEAADGDYVLYHGNDPGRAWTAHCVDMAGTPVEYLTLEATDPGHNFSQYRAGGFVSGTDVVTTVTRVRIDPVTLKVQIFDTTFATSTGQIGGTTEMPYAQGANCSWDKSETAAGRFDVDLTGTRFTVESDFCIMGHVASGDWAFSSDDQVVSGYGAGECGDVRPLPWCEHEAAGKGDTDPDWGWFLHLGLESCPEGHTGVDCDVCLDGWQDGDGDGACAPDCETAGLECPLLTACSDESGLATCVCIEGHTGEGCTACAEGWQDNDEDGLCAPACAAGLCGEGTACVDFSGAVVCAELFPATCAEVVTGLEGAADGDHVLYHGNDPARAWTAYCHGMAGEPVEYLPLVETDAGRNFSRYRAGEFVTGTDVVTAFTRLRIDPVTLKVQIFDTTFATSSGQIGTVTVMPYAQGANCTWLKGEAVAGRFNIDLTGTRFTVESDFCITGHVEYGSWTFSADDQVVDGYGGGECGDVRPLPWCEHVDAGKDDTDPEWGWFVHLGLASCPEGMGGVDCDVVLE